VTTVAFSPCGELLATGARDRRVICWDTRSLCARTQLDGHTGHVGAVAFAPGGRLLASGCSDGLVIVWETARWSRVRVLRGHDGTVHALAWARRGAERELIATAGNPRSSGDAVIRVHPDLQKEHERTATRRAVRAAWCALSHPLVGKVWDVSRIHAPTAQAESSDSSDVVPCSLRAHEGTVRALAFAPNSDLLGANPSQHLPFAKHREIEIRRASTLCSRFTALGDSIGRR
jgi:WD40 repeat protein